MNPTGEARAYLTALNLHRAAVSAFAAARRAQLGPGIVRLTRPRDARRPVLYMLSAGQPASLPPFLLAALAYASARPEAVAILAPHHCRQRRALYALAPGQPPRHMGDLPE